MSQQLISRSADLTRLQNAGYAIRIVGGLLVIDDIPFVSSSRSVERGILVSELTLAGDTTRRPSTHVVSFVGEIPCDQHGAQLSNVINSVGPSDLGHGLVASCTFSSKPKDGYRDYEHKMSTYISILEGHAAALDPMATSRTFPIVTATDAVSPFVYLDTASSRVGIDEINRVFVGQRIAIVGLGGTGGYILDLVAKTPVAELHLFDGDKLLQHNAFRAPGAATAEQLSDHPFKVDYFATVYGEMRRGITPHPVFVDESNVDELDEMDFVFLAMDAGVAKKTLAHYLTQASIPFIDSGIGIYEVDGKLAGTIRVTTSTHERSSHVWDHMSFGDADVNGEYSTNIQVADLNALAATLAVGRWKRHSGFYNDLEREHHSLYDIDGNAITNAECA